MTTRDKVRPPFLKYSFVSSVSIILFVLSFQSRIYDLYFPQDALAKMPAISKPPNYVNISDKPSIISPTTNQTLSVRGVINLSDSTIELYPFMILPGSKFTERPRNSSFDIDLLDSKGITLAHYPFEPKVYTDMSQGRGKLAILSEAIPFVPYTKEIVISKDNKQLASRSVDDYAPSANIIFPIGGETLTGRVTVKWQANDPDGDNLTYFLLYSTDAGRSWQTVASDIRATQLTVNLGTLPGSNMALFRIIATDGVNTAISDSKSTFNVPSTSSVG
jgi:hypothetical protein